MDTKGFCYSITLDDNNDIYNNRGAKCCNKVKFILHKIQYISNI